MDSDFNVQEWMQIWEWTVGVDGVDESNTGVDNIAGVDVDADIGACRYRTGVDGGIGGLGVDVVDVQVFRLGLDLDPWGDPRKSRFSIPPKVVQKCQECLTSMQQAQTSTPFDLTV